MSGKGLLAMSGNERRNPIDSPHTRRTFLRYGGSLGLAAASLSGGSLFRAAAAAGTIVHQPDSLPNPKAPAGTVNEWPETRAPFSIMEITEYARDAAPTTTS